MTTTPVPSQHYALIIDKNRNEILAALFETALQNPIGKAMFEMRCRSNNIAWEDVITFVRETADKEHALSWCTDPNCLYKKNQENI